MAEEINKKDIEELRRLIKLLNKDISEADFESLVKSGNAAKTLLSSLKKEAEAITADIGDINDGFKNIVNEIRRTNSTTNDVAKSFDRLSSVAEQIKFHQRGISQLSLKEIQSSQTKVAVEKERLRDSVSSLTQRKSELQTQLNELNIKKATIGLTDAELKERRKLGQEYEKTKASLNNINDVISGQDELYNGLVTTIGKVKNQIEDSNKLLGLGGNVITGLSETLKTVGLGKLSDQLGIDEAKDKMKSLSQQIIADRERETVLQNNLKSLTEEAIKVSDQLVSREKELLDVKEKINLIDTLTQRKDEIRLQLEELNAKKVSIGLTQDEIKERKKLGAEYKNLKASLEDLGSIKSAKELEDSLERQVEIIKNKKEEIDNVIEAEKKELDTITATNKQYEGMGGKISVLKTGLTSMGGSLFKNLTDPLTISLFLVKSLVGAFLSADTAIGELAKGFNMTYSNALKTRQELTSIAAASGDAAVNTDGLQQSMMAIGQSLGSNAKLNEKDLITFTKLREQAGYTNEELVGMQKLTLATGGNLEDNTKQFLGTVKVLSAQNKLVLNEKQLLKEVSNVSNAIKLSLGGSVKNLAEAVVKTKQFGINLDQADKIAGGLLDFEKSINAELEAELLTGKDLNLDKARLLALNGDIAGASAEILKQVGGTAEFSKMNRIQQEAMANAVGLTREELANSLVEREALAKLSGVEGKTAKERYDNLVKQVGVEEAQKRLGNEALATQFEQQSTQEKFNQAIVKLKDLMIKLVEGPFGTFLEGLSNAVGLVGDIIGKFGKLGDYLKGLLGEDVAGVLGKAASIAAVGALAGVIGKSLLRGTSFNPLYVKIKGGMGGMSPDLDIDGGTGGGGGGTGKGKGRGKPGGFGRLKQAFKGGGFKGLAKSAGRMLKSGAPKLIKGAAGGIGSLAGGLALDYASSKQFEKQAQLEQEAQLIIDEKEKKKKLEEAEKAKNIGKGLDVGSAALTGAGLGATIGSAFFGIGAAPGAAIGGILGAGYGLLSNYGNTDKTKEAEIDAEPAEDFIIRPGQKPIKYNKGDIIIGGTNLDKNLKSTTPPPPPPISTFKDSGIISALSNLGKQFDNAIDKLISKIDSLIKNTPVKSTGGKENIKNDLISISDFFKANKLQQEAIAKAIGTTREELTNKLNNQDKNINKLSNVNLDKSNLLIKESTSKTSGITKEELTKLNENKETIKFDSLFAKLDTLIESINNLIPKFNLDDLTTIVNVDLPKFDDVASKLDLLIESINNLMSKFNLDKLTTVVNIDLPKFDTLASKLDLFIDQINNLVSKFNLDKLTTIVNIDLPKFDDLLIKLDSLISSNASIINELNKISTKSIEIKPNIEINPQTNVETNKTISSPTIEKQTKEIDINLLATELRDIKTILRDTLNIDKEMSLSLRDSNRKETQITLDGTRVGTAVSVTTYKTQ